MRHRRSGLIALAALAAVALGGCSTRPDQTEILIGTTPPGASCTLFRQGQPVAAVASTPGIALVEPSPDEINISCSRQGYTDAAATLAARDTGPNIGAVIFGRPASDFERRIDIALSPR